MPRLRGIWADGAYTGPLVDWGWRLRRYRKIRLEIVKRSDDMKGFVARFFRLSKEVGQKVLPVAFKLIQNLLG